MVIYSIAGGGTIVSTVVNPSLPESAEILCQIADSKVKGVSAEIRALPLEPRGFRSLGLIISAKRQGEHVLRSFVRSTRSTIKTMYGKETGF